MDNGEKILRTSTDVELSLTCQDRPFTSFDTPTSLTETAYDVTFLKKDTYCEESIGPVSNSVIEHIGAALNESNLFPIFSTTSKGSSLSSSVSKGPIQGSQINDEMKKSDNLMLKQPDHSDVALECSLNVSETYSKSNPFKKNRSNKLKATFILETTNLELSKEDKSLIQDITKNKDKKKNNPFINVKIKENYSLDSISSIDNSLEENVCGATGNALISAQEVPLLREETNDFKMKTNIFNRDIKKKYSIDLSMSIDNSTLKNEYQPESVEKELPMECTDNVTIENVGNNSNLVTTTSIKISEIQVEKNQELNEIQDEELNQDMGLSIKQLNAAESQIQEADNIWQSEDCADVIENSEKHDISKKIVDNIEMVSVLHCTKYSSTSKSINNWDKSDCIMSNLGNSESCISMDIENTLDFHSSLNSDVENNQRSHLNLPEPDDTPQIEGRSKDEQNTCTTLPNSICTKISVDNKFQNKESANKIVTTKRQSPIEDDRITATSSFKIIECDVSESEHCRAEETKDHSHYFSVVKDPKITECESDEEVGVHSHKISAVNIENVVLMKPDVYIELEIEPFEQPIQSSEHENNKIKLNYDVEANNSTPDKQNQSQKQLCIKNNNRKDDDEQSNKTKKREVIKNHRNKSQACDREYSEGVVDALVQDAIVSLTVKSKKQSKQVLTEYAKPINHSLGEKLVCPSAPENNAATDSTIIDAEHSKIVLDNVAEIVIDDKSSPSNNKNAEVGNESIKKVSSQVSNQATKDAGSFGEMSLSIDISEIPNNKSVHSKKIKYTSTPLGHRILRSRITSSKNKNNSKSAKDVQHDSSYEDIPNLLKNENHSKEVAQTKDFVFRAPTRAPKKSNVSLKLKARKSVTFRPNSSIVPLSDKSVQVIDTKKSEISYSAKRKSRHDTPKKTTKKRKSSNLESSKSGKSLLINSSFSTPTKYKRKRISNLTEKKRFKRDIPLDASHDVSAIVPTTPKQPRCSVFHSTPKHRASSFTLINSKLSESYTTLPTSMYTTSESDTAPTNSDNKSVTRRSLRSNSSNSTLRRNSSNDTIRRNNSSNYRQCYNSRTKIRTETIQEISSCFNRPPDSFSTDLEISRTVAHTTSQKRLAHVENKRDEISKITGTSRMTLRSSTAYSLQESAAVELSETDLTTTVYNPSITEKSVTLISKFGKKKNNEESTFEEIKKKKVKSRQEPLPKLAKPAKWIRKDVYKFLDKKLKIKYPLEKRVISERIVLLLYNTVTNTLSGHPEISEPMLKVELVKYDICNTQLEYYTFLHRYTPIEFIKVAIPMGRAYGQTFKDNNLKVNDPLV